MDRRASYAAIAAALVLAGCSGGHTPEAATQTVTATQTLEHTATVATTTSSATTTTTTTIATPAVPVIDRLEIETTAVGSGKVGPGRYQLKQVYSSSKPYVGIKYGWTSYVGDQELSGHDCTAVGTVTGPGGFEAVQHSDACSRSMYKIGDSVTFNAVGTYNVTVSVTPKDGQEVTATETIEVIAMDK